MTTNHDDPIVSVVIPCYRQIELARKCLASVLAQSFDSMEVILLDDGDSREYEQLARSASDARVHYQNNTRRLGAMSNMFRAIRIGRGRYSVAFHEDDLLGKGYLAAAVDLLDRNPDLGFVAGRLRFFDDDPEEPESGREHPEPSVEHYDTAADFTRAILHGAEPMFGSVVYRRSAAEPAEPELETMGTLCDRPFLLSIMKDWKSALMHEPRVYCRLHGNDDRRHDSLTEQHVLEFMRAYRTTLPARLSKADQRSLSRYVERLLPQLHRLIPAARRPAFLKLVLRAWRDGTYYPHTMGRSGAKLIARSLVS